MATTRRTLLAGAAALAATTTFAEAADEIAIGCTCPVTGPLSTSGQQYYFSLQMAQDDINAKGGIGGKKLRIVFEDTRDSNAVAVNAFLKLVRDLQPPAVLLSSYTTQNLATEPDVTKAAIPCLYSGGGDSVQDKHNKWMFRIRPNDGIQGLAIAKFLQEDVKAKKAAVIYIQNDFGQGVANTVDKLMKQAGSPLIARESYGANDKDMSAQLLGFKSKGADAIVTISYGVDGSLILKQIKQLGMTQPVMASSGVMVPAALNLCTPDEVANLHGIIDAFLDESRQDATGDYARRFRQRFNIKADPYGSCYYDAAFMLKEGIEKVGTDPEKLRDFFATLKGFKGVTNTFTTDADNNMVHSVAVVAFKPGTTDMSFVRTLDVT